jgi:hypothetical protein
VSHPRQCESRFSSDFERGRLSLTAIGPPTTNPSSHKSKNTDDNRLATLDAFEDADKSADSDDSDQNKSSEIFDVAVFHPDEFRLLRIWVVVRFGKVSFCHISPLRSAIPLDESRFCLSEVEVEQW